MNSILLCQKCQKEIKPQENFIEVIEWNNKKVIKKNYMHKSCWDLLMDMKNTTRQALGMAKGLMTKIGLEPKQEYVI